MKMFILSGGYINKLGQTFDVDWVSEQHLLKSSKIGINSL